MLKTIAVVILALATVAVAAQTKTVEYTVEGQKYKAHLATPDKGEPIADILVFPEWWGVTDYAKHRANMLADLGYAALAVDLYGDGQTTGDPQDAAKLSSALKNDPKKLHAISQAALDAFQAQDNLNDRPVAATGYCFGGFAALEFARTGAPLAGVVTFHGDLGTKNSDGGKNVKGKLLICHGADDPMVTGNDVMMFQKEMDDAHITYAILILSGAQHSFTNPKADQYGLKGVAYNKAADDASWTAMKGFFGDLFQTVKQNQ